MDKNSLPLNAVGESPVVRKRQRFRRFIVSTILPAARISPENVPGPVTSSNITLVRLNALKNIHRCGFDDHKVTARGDLLSNRIQLLSSVVDDSVTGDNRSNRVRWNNARRR